MDRKQPLAGLTLGGRAGPSGQTFQRKEEDSSRTLGSLPHSDLHAYPLHPVQVGGVHTAGWLMWLRHGRYEKRAS